LPVGNTESPTAVKVDEGGMGTRHVLARVDVERSRPSSQRDIGNVGVNFIRSRDPPGVDLAERGPGLPTQQQHRTESRQTNGTPSAHGHPPSRGCYGRERVTGALRRTSGTTGTNPFQRR